MIYSYNEESFSSLKIVKFETCGTYFKGIKYVEIFE